MENKSRDIPSPARTSFGPLKETRNLRVNGSASIEELKEFLGTLKGKNPQEVIGLVSSSLLIQSLTIASIATIAFFAVFTVGPYLAYGPLKKSDLSAKPGAAQQKNEPTAAGGKGEAATTAASGAAEKSAAPDASKAAKALGIDEVKESDPTKNPLDKGPNIDNLLDGLDK